MRDGDQGRKEQRGECRQIFHMKYHYCEMANLHNFAITGTYIQMRHD